MRKINCVIFSPVRKYLMGNNVYEKLSNIVC